MLLCREANLRTSQRPPLPTKPTAHQAQSALLHRRPNAAAARRRPSGMKSSAGDVDVELLKAVAQAWHAQSGNPRPSRASDTAGDDNDAAGAGARPRAGAAAHRPSRFKLEAMAAAAASEARASETPWNFGQSLWDTYELVSVARRLESGLVIADHAAAAAPAVTQGGDARGAGKQARVSGRSLMSLFLRSTSRRFEGPSG